MNKEQGATSKEERRQSVAREPGEIVSPEEERVVCEWVSE